MNVINPVNFLIAFVLISIFGQTWGWIEGPLNTIMVI